MSQQVARTAVAEPTIRGGPALKRAIHVAREAKGITSDTALAAQARVHYDTLMNWFGEKTVPRPSELQKVAQVLGISLVELMDSYEGRTAETASLHGILSSLVEEIRLLRETIEADRG